MNRATTAAVFSFQTNHFIGGASFFHSTAALNRRRHTYWSSGGGTPRRQSKRYTKQSGWFRNHNVKQQLLRNVGVFAEHLFQGVERGYDGYDSDSCQGSSWFRQEYWDKGSRRGKMSSKGYQMFGRRDFQFFESDDDMETIFRSAFDGNRSFYWSFVKEEQQPRSSSRFSSYYGNSWNWAHQDEEEYDFSTESENSESNMTSDRLALGLSASGPLSMDDVKNAYRTCALKWHPDRHQGLSKTVAEEKFKVCSAAYQSLCDKLSLS